jgi:cell division protein FtsB
MPEGKENKYLVYVIVLLSSIVIASISYMVTSSLLGATGFFVGNFSAEVKSITPSGVEVSAPSASLANFSVEPEFVPILLLQGTGQSKSIDIINYGKGRLNVTLEGFNLDNFLVISEKSFNIDAGKKKTINLNFFAASEQKPGVYTGRIMVSSGQISKTINVVVEVKEGNPLFDLSIRVLPEYKSVNAGDTIKTNISMENLGAGQSVVNLRIYITDFDRHIIYQSSKEIVGVVNKLNLERELIIPSDAPAGKYLAIAEIEYAGFKAETYDTFDVVEKTVAKTIGKAAPAIATIASILALILSAWIVWRYLTKPKKTLKKRRKRIEYDEEELEVLRIRRQKLKEQLKKLKRAYKEGVIEEKGFRRTKAELSRKIKDISREIRG